MDQVAVQAGTGEVFAPPRVAVKPHEVLAPAPSEPLYGMLRALTASPEPPTAAFHTLLKRCPSGHVQLTVQPVIAADRR